MSQIALSAGVRANLLSLQNTAALMQKTQTNLATGKKVNSALDNPLNFFTSQNLNNRADALNGLLDAMSNGIQTIQAANNGITSITTLVKQLESVASQARGDTTSPQAVSTVLSSGAALTGDLSATSMTIADGSGNTAVLIDASAWTGTGVGKANQTAQNVVDGINSQLAAAGSTVTASLVGTEIKLTNSTGQVITVGGTTTGFGIATSTVSTDGKPMSAVRQSLMNQYNNLLAQIDQLAGDAGYNGTNLLNADKLTLNFNENGTSSIAIQMVDSTGAKFAINATNLGLTAQTDFSTNSTLDALTSTLNAALTTLQTQSTAISSSLSVVQTRQDFTKNMVNTLQTGADNLVLADPNQEGANLLALQTRQSLSTTALSMASQADQAVLRLFQ
jgi:flagellin-like hook-associated protein FlgL